MGVSKLSAKVLFFKVNYFNLFPISNNLNKTVSIKITSIIKMFLSNKSAY